MSEFITCGKLGAMAQRCGGASQLRKHLQRLRARYLADSLSEGMRRLLSNAAIGTETAMFSEAADAASIADSMDFDWGNWKHHLQHRLHLNYTSSGADFALAKELLVLSDDAYRRMLDIVKSGMPVNSDGGPSKLEKHHYDMSMLPLNLVLGEEVQKYFLPPSDYFTPHATNLPDPYGLIHGRSRAKHAQGSPTVIANGSSRHILCTHKFTNTILINIDLHCPMGCSDCYKTRMGTRECSMTSVGTKVRSPKIYMHAELGKLLPPSPGKWVEHVAQVVAWMNGTARGQEVYDVILSGGEPLIALSNDVLKQILEQLQQAKHLRVLRVCTGCLFLGLPFRIDDELVTILADFAERTGIRVTFQVHLGSQKMITPEAAIAAKRLRRAGLTAYTQVPIKNGINFFLDDLDGTINDLAQLGKKQVAVGVEPYMFIVDMHPSTNAFYVPIEPLMHVWAELVESHDHPGLERPRTLSVLFSEGNIILSGHTLFAARKIVDRENDCVKYEIPRVGINPRNGVSEVFAYIEPLLQGINDDPQSLSILQKSWSGREPGGIKHGK
jgi:L-lysine 2,3-aminomutase